MLFQEIEALPALKTLAERRPLPFLEAYRMNYFALQAVPQPRLSYKVTAEPFLVHDASSSLSRCLTAKDDMPSANASEISSISDLGSALKTAMRNALESNH
jgi:hypothetical protein